MHFQFFFLLSGADRRRAGGQGAPKEKYAEDEKYKGRTKPANPAASSEQCSRACRDKRTARRAIGRELSKQMSPRGANVKSKTCQLARKAGATSNSRYQRAEIVNSAWGRTINLKSGVKTKTTTGSSKTRALTKSVPFRVKMNFRKICQTV